MTHSARHPVGSVVTLWRYPVKSMLGEELNASNVTERGLAGDRGYALVDSADGKIASAKNPRKWPRMFQFRAAFAGPPQIRRVATARSASRCPTESRSAASRPTTTNVSPGHSSVP